MHGEAVGRAGAHRAAPLPPPGQFAGVMTTHTSRNRGMKPRDAHRARPRASRAGSGRVRRTCADADGTSAPLSTENAARRPGYAARSAAALRALSTPTVATARPGHLRDREQRVEPVEHAEARAHGTPTPGGPCAQRPSGQRRGQACLPQIRTRRPRFTAPSFAYSATAFRRAMRRAHLELVTDTLLVEEVECRLHALAIRLRADEDPTSVRAGLRHGRYHGGISRRR